MLSSLLIGTFAEQVIGSIAMEFIEMEQCEISIAGIVPIHWQAMAQKIADVHWISNSILQKYIHIYQSGTWRLCMVVTTVGFSHDIPFKKKTVS